MGIEPRTDLEALRSEISRFHKTLLDAHWEKDVEFFTQDLSEDFLTVSEGEIRKPTLDDIYTTTSNYLNNTTFTEYRYLREPTIGISKDGSMAWSIAQVSVVGTRNMEDSSERDVDFICRWITVFERQDGKWIRRTEVSSFSEYTEA
jgi:hypothetical protein